MAAVVFFSLQFISHNTHAYFDGFGPANAYSSTLGSNLQSSIAATNNMVMQQAAIQQQQLSANLNASFAQQAVTAQRAQAMTAGNFSALGQLDMASSQIAQQQAAQTAAANQAISQTNLQHQAEQAAIQHSNMAAMTQYSRAVDGAIYSAGMSDGETGRSNGTEADQAWFDAHNDMSDWVGSSDGGGSADLGEAFSSSIGHGDHADNDDHDDHEHGDLPDGHYGPEDFAIEDAKARGPASKGKTEVPTLHLGTRTVPDLGPSQEMIEFREALNHATFREIDDQGNAKYDYTFDNYVVRPTDDFFDQGSTDVIRSLYRIGQQEQKMFQNFNLPDRALVQLTPRDMFNIYEVPGMCDNCKPWELAEGARQTTDPDTLQTKYGPNAAYNWKTDTMVLRAGFADRTFQHETGHAVDDKIVRAPGNEALAALVKRGFEVAEKAPEYRQYNGEKSYAATLRGEAFAESFATQFSPNPYAANFYRGLVVDMKTMRDVNPDMAVAVTGIVGGAYPTASSGSSAGTGISRMDEPSFIGFGASGASSGGGYSSISYNNAIASLKTFGSSFDSFGSVLTKLGATTVPNYGGNGLQGIVLAKEDLVGAKVSAQASYNPWARDAEAKALDLALRGIGVGKAGLAAVELQGNVTADQAISCVDAGAVQSSQNAGVFRFHMASTGEHFITTSLQEGCSVGFKFEAVAFKMLEQGEGTKPLYRCWTTKNHFISDRADCEGHRVEGVMGFASAKPAAGLVPLHRGIHVIGDILSTIDKTELDRNQYQYQGVLGYVLPPGASTQVASK